MFKSFIKLTIIATIVSFVFTYPIAFAATYSSGSAALSSPAASATSVSYTLTFSGVTTSTVKCIQAQITTTVGGSTLPTGMSTASTTFSSSSNYVPTPASWTVSNAGSANGLIKLTYTTGETPASGSSRTIILGGITNSSSTGTYYVRVQTFNNTDCSSSGVDSGDVAFAITSAVTVSGTVNPTLTYTIGDSSSCAALGTLSTSSATSCSHTIAAATNAASGYTISYTSASTVPTHAVNGSYTISQIGATAAASSTGSEQFGINLKNNATPDVGADPSGGSGSASSNYSTADSFAFTTSGASIATASAPTATTTFTASYIVNIANTTQPGSYSASVIYNITANY